MFEGILVYPRCVCVGWGMQPECELFYPMGLGMNEKANCAPACTSVCFLWAHSDPQPRALHLRHPTTKNCTLQPQVKANLHLSSPLCQSDEKSGENGGMAQCFRVFAALAEDGAWVPGPHWVAHNCPYSSSRDPTPSVGAHT